MATAPSTVQASYPITVAVRNQRTGEVWYVERVVMWGKRYYRAYTDTPWRRTIALAKQDRLPA